MRTGYSILFTCLFLYGFVTALGQSFSPEEQRQLDSLNAIISDPSSHDTSLAGAYVGLSDILYVSNLDTVIPLCSKAQQIAEKVLAANPPNSYRDAPVARALCIALADALNNIGFIHQHFRGNIPLALEYFHKSLKIREEISDKDGMANSYNNIGGIHKDQGDIPLALEYLHKGLKIREEISDKKGMATSYNNIGYIYSNQGDPSVTSSKEESLRAGRALALEYSHKSLKISEEIGNRLGTSNYLASIGTLHLGAGSDGAARESGERGLKIALELGFPDQIERNAGLLSKVARKQGNYKEALEMYELQVQYRDSMKNEETQKASIRQQTKYEFEKAQLVKEQEQKETARLKAEATDRRDNLQYSVILIALLVLGAGVLALGRISVSTRVAEGLIFFSFLILFEFLLVLADPYIEGWSGGAPGIKLLFNAGIAALIFPAHAFFEAKMKGRLVKG